MTTEVQTPVRIKNWLISSLRDRCERQDADGNSCDDRALEFDDCCSSCQMARAIHAVWDAEVIELEESPGRAVISLSRESFIRGSEWKLAAISYWEDHSEDLIRNALFDLNAIRGRHSLGGALREIEIHVNMTVLSGHDCLDSLFSFLPLVNWKWQYGDSDGQVVCKSYRLAARFASCSRTSPQRVAKNIVGWAAPIPSSWTQLETAYIEYWRAKNGG